ncbi:MAG: ATP-binding cassette domain-containing protein [Acidimicrobiia bacterium]|nr:ATP-binding cassette domain-containing protein [Acidimicrobiia bacterium]
MAATTGRRTRTPTVLQMDPTECGAAALTAVLNYFGRAVRLQEVREACSVARDGMTTRNMVQAATSMGFTCAEEARRADALADLQTPYLASWKPSQFVVVEELGARRVRLNDPASGHRRLSRGQFDESYDGTVLTVAQPPGFHRDPPLPRRRPTLEMLALLARSGSGIVYALVAGVALVVPTTAAAMLTAIFVAQVLEAHNHNWAGTVIGVAVLVAVLLFSLSLFQQRILLRLRMRLSIRMSAVFLWHLLRVPTRFFDSRSPGGLVSRVQFNNYIAHLLSGDLATAVISVVTMTLFAVVMAVLSPVLAAAAIVVALFNLGALLGVSRVRTSINQELQQTLVRLSGYTYVGINMIDDIKATGAEDEYFARWTGIQAEAVNAGQRLGVPTQGLLVVPGFLALFDFIVVLAVGGELVIDGSLSLAHLIAFQILSASFFAPISQFVTVASKFQDARAWMQQIGEVTDEGTDEAVVQATGRLGDAAEDRPAPAPIIGPTAADVGQRLPTTRLRGQVELRGITFGYSRTEPALVEDLSVTLEPGMRVAFVGPTGSGKSTVANIVAGLLQPWSGEVLFDGRPREEITREVMAASLGKVDQSIVLFSGSVVDNIRFWDESVPHADAVRGAEDACIAADIQSKPDGFGHHLTEGGRNLSGGQRQRLEIARVLATNPSIVILDEATSALDAVTEEAVDTNLRRRGCTCLLIAHRLSTIRDCDQILVLDGGRVVQRGTHEELLAQGGLYEELVSSA